MKIISKKLKNTILTLLVLSLHFYVIAQVKDVDGNKYETIKIGESEWMSENLSVKHFQNGEPIKFVTNCEEWLIAGKNKEPACCFIDFKSSNAKYGLLYNWYAVNDVRNIAPKGFKVPASSDFEKLISNFGGTDHAGYELRSNKGWKEQQGNNQSGMNILPIGCLNGNHENHECSNVYSGEYSYLWSSTPVTSIMEEKNLRPYGYFLRVTGWDGDAQMMSNPYFHEGLPVRCIKN